MRESGVLLHITSLPSKFGVGSLGTEADNFIKFLSRAGQRYWQILPVNPVDCVNSPYASPSSYAGNYLLIDVEQLLADGLISSADIDSIPRCNGIDYEVAKVTKKTILKKAFFNFFSQPNLTDFFNFIDKNSFWLEDYALYSAIKEKHNGSSWIDWESELAFRDETALTKAKEEYEELIDYYRFEQFVFYSQWKIFRKKLFDANIKLIGDIPFYVAYDSVEVWVNRKLFVLDKNGYPKIVAGVSPDYFSKDGQLWGNPIYNYKKMRLDSYDWWSKRLLHCAEMFDVLRVDHFRAFDSYYTVKFGSKTARKGKWVKGEGKKLLSIIKNLSPLKIVAEDLGTIPQSVYDLRDEFNLDGMKIMQFAFDGNKNNPFLPENYSPNCVAYLGTHDNQTTAGWFSSLLPKNKTIALNYLGLPKDATAEQVTKQMLTKLFESPANIVIASMQDLNSLDDSYRMNTPGTVGCWKYMESPKNFSMATALFLESITVQSHRIPQKSGESATER